MDTTLVYSYMYIDILLMTRQSSCPFVYNVLGLRIYIELWYAPGDLPLGC